MKNIKIVLVIIVFLQSVFLVAQDYSFIPKGLHKMNDEEMLKHQVQFNANMQMFDEEGYEIKSKQLNDIMISGNFIPIVFGNKAHEPKVVVFRKATKEEKEILKNAIIKQNPNTNFKPGEIAKHFVTSDLSGEKVELNNLKGKIVVLNFWFIKCYPCVEEIPELNKIVSKYSNEDVEFIAITFDKQDELKNFLNTHKFNYRIVSDGSVIKKYQVNTFPMHIVIDRKGEIIFKKTGAYLNELDTKIESLLKK